MAQATLLVFVVASALVCVTLMASRDEETHRKSDMLVSVSPASFARVHESPNSGEAKETRTTKTSAFAELNSQPAEEPSHEAAMLSRAKEQPAAKAGDSSTVSSDEAAAAASWKAAAQSTVHQVAKAAAGLSVIGDDSRALRKAVAELFEEGEAEAAAASKRRAEAVAKLHDYVRESHQARQRADALDEDMKESYSRLTGKKVQSESKNENMVVNVKDRHEGVEAQFAQLEKETEHVMGMFDKIRRLRAIGQDLQASRDSIVKEAAASGLSADEIQKHFVLAHEKAKVIAEASPSGATDLAKADGMEAEQKEHLKDLLASSAIEMAQIESAASDVVNGLDAFTAWKQKQDDSPASLAEAASVKSRLSKAVKFLEDHENLVSVRSKQINDLMAKSHLSSLS